MVQYTSDSGTLVPEMLNELGHNYEDEGTLLPSSRRSGTMVELDSNLGTMVINSDDDEESTMKSGSLKKFISSILQIEHCQKILLFCTNFIIIIILGHDTGPGESGKKYRPLFLDHFDKKEAENNKVRKRPFNFLID